MNVDFVIGIVVLLVFAMALVVLMRGANKYRSGKPKEVDPRRTRDAAPEEVGHAVSPEWVKRIRRERGLLGGTEPGAESGVGGYSIGGGGDGGGGE